MVALVLRLFRDEQGQDLIEYALLTAFIGFAGIAVFNLLLGVISNTYGYQEDAVNSLCVPPDPGTTAAQSCVAAS
jgi:Flp pilus assembly pilin Flp